MVNGKTIFKNFYPFAIKNTQYTLYVKVCKIIIFSFGVLKEFNFERKILKQDNCFFLICF